MKEDSVSGIVRIGLFGIGLAALALPLAGCGSKQETKTEGAASSAAPADIAHEAAKLDRPKPGSYSQTIEVIDMQIPGMPKEAADQMRAMTGKPQVHTICITDEDTRKGYQEMLQNVGKDGECTYSRFDVAGGHLDAQMHCSKPGQGEATMTMNGTVSETGSDVTIGMNTTGGEGPMGAVKMKMHMISQRIGDCPS